MQGTYNLWLVALSYVVAVLASYSALELSRRISNSSGADARAWLAVGSVAMGIGIWTMHFIGMQAFSLPIPFHFDVGVTLLSLLVAIGAAGFAIFVASRRDNTFRKILLSGAVLGAGIAAMHYTGMAAMEVSATISYDVGIGALSILVAIAAACAALWIMFTLIETRSRHLWLMKIGAGLLMGIAICGMHYTGMAAADYEYVAGMIESAAPGDHAWLAPTITTVTLVILGFTLLTIFFDQKLQVEQRHSARSEQEKAQLIDVLDESSNEIFFVDSETHRFVYVNRGALDNLGYSKEEFREKSLLDIAPDFDADSLKKLVQPLVRGTEKELLFETRHARKNGSDYHVQVNLQLSRVVNPPVFVAVITDISARRDMEVQLLQAQKMQSIGQLAAGIAHEINTPAQFVGDNTRFVQDAFKDLIGISDSLRKLYEAARTGQITPELLDEIAQAMEEADVEFLTEEIPTAIEQSLDGISRISNIVRAMKEFSHPGGKDCEATDLNSAVTNTVTVASNEWKYVADVETRLADDLPSVMCHPQEVNQVILNLIVNAAHAIEERNKSESAEKGRITISTRIAGEFAEIAIADTGCGIPEDIRDRVFEPFFTTKEVGKGTGQGLAMAYSTIVEQHKGELRVDSTPGEGTTFTIRLPLAQQEGVKDKEAA